MSERPAGPLLDELGVTIELDDGDRIAEVLVLLKVVDMETGQVALGVSSNRLDWIAKGGLLDAARQVFYGESPQLKDDD